MENTAIFYAFPVLTGLVTGNNFLIFFIALVVVFFLLGLILGLNLALGKKNSREKTASDSEEIQSNIRQEDPVVHDVRDTTNTINNKANQKPTEIRNKNYYRYW